MAEKNNSKTSEAKMKGGLYYILLGIAVLSVVNTFGIYALNNKINLVISGNTANSDGDTGDTILKPSDNNQPSNQPSNNQPAQNQPQRLQVSADDDSVKGSKDALVTIIEFSDYQCPFCGRFFTQTLPSIQKDYIDTGKVKLVYRDYPLPFHENAQKAAEAAECAGEQVKYWEYHDKLFQNQGALDVASLKKYAADLKLNTAKFDSCLDTGQMAAEVQKDLKDGESYGVGGTPTFFINGIGLVGAQPYSAFQQVIEQELSK